MLILLHDSHGDELVVSTDIIAMVSEQWATHLMSVRYILSTTTGEEITIKESPREVKSLQDQEVERVKGER
jgi:hypothetical protein